MKTKIVWRLKEHPTTKNIQELVTTGILTKDEAREILFSSEAEEDRDKRSLENEIKFLRSVVEKLSQGANTKIIEVVREIATPRYLNYPWYTPYQTWCYNAAGNALSSATGTYISNGTGMLTGLSAHTTEGSTTASIDYVTTASTAGNFSDIKTFG